MGGAARGLLAVTVPQSVALQHPCFLAADAVHPRFGYVLSSRLSLVLTINAGYE